MRDIVLYGIELIVGAACLAAVPGLGGRSRVAGALLLAAGAAAVVHAVWAMVAR
jgi:hypothetical protein